jgi:DNA-binding beta-propeller fold protein YncE
MLCVISFLVFVSYAWATPGLGKPGLAPHFLWGRGFTGNKFDCCGDTRTAIALSPDGSTIYVTGRVVNVGTGPDYGTVAYDPTGHIVWKAMYGAPGNGVDTALALAVSPDDARVFVTGASSGDRTVAYDAHTGTQLWTSSQPGYPTAIAVSPDGQSVYVTGSVLNNGTGEDYDTAAFDATTGEQQWDVQYKGPGDAQDWASTIGVSPDGTKVFVTGAGDAYQQDSSMTTVAYEAATGSTIWTQQHQGTAGGNAWAYGLTVAPDGSSVFVTGFVQDLSPDYATICYEAATGSVIWADRYDGQGQGADTAEALGLSPDGSTLYVTGESDADFGNYDYATIAYTASTGARLWTTRYDSAFHFEDHPVGVAAARDGTRVYVTGWSLDSHYGPHYATVAYEAATGSELWRSRSPKPGGDYTYGLAVSPDGTVYVTGELHETPAGLGFAYGTVAYRP